MTGRTQVIGRPPGLRKPCGKGKNPVALESSSSQQPAALFGFADAQALALARVGFLLASSRSKSCSTRHTPAGRAVYHLVLFALQAYAANITTRVRRGVAPHS